MTYFGCSYPCSALLKGVQNEVSFLTCPMFSLYFSLAVSGERTLWYFRFVSIPAGPDLINSMSCLLETVLVNVAL